MAANPNAVVSADWIREHLDDPNVAFVQVDTERAGYDAAHLPGCVYADGYDQFTSERDGVRALVPLREELEERLGAMGIDESKTVVFVSSGKSPWPSRGYWVMRFFRFPSTHIADRSVAALAQAGVPTTTEVPAIEPRTCKLDEPDESLLSTWEQVLKVAQGDDSAQILDCRSDGEYAGRPGAHAAPRLGRVPRAYHLNWEVLVDENGTFLPVDQLRALYAAAGIDGSKPVYPYCGGGIRSAASWFAMRELIGWDLATNYDGSWAEWSVRTDLPIVADV